MKATLVPLALFLLFALPAGATDPATILARAKEAAGGAAWDAVATLHTHARVATSGLSGTADSWEELQSGRAVTTFSLGPYQGAEGFDGKAAWSQDGSGETRVDDSGDAREGAVNDAYRRSLGYWYPQGRPAELAGAGERSEGDRRFHVLRIVPQGGRPFEMWLDAATLLIDRTVEKTARETRTTFFSDYRTVQGVKLPFASRITNGEAKYDQLVAVETIEVNPPIDEAKLRMPEGRSHDFSIAGGETSVTLPFQRLNNHVYVEARINGEPLQVLFDTGGANVVTPGAARRLGLKPEGALQVQGSGQKTEDSGLVRVRELALGGVALRDQPFFVLPLDRMAEVEGVAVDGIVGYEVLKRLVARIEYSRQKLTLTLPEAFQEAGAGIAVPFTFNGETPQIDGEIDGVAGKLTIDTGSRTSLTLHAPFAQEHDLKAKYAPKLEAMTGWGVGGSVRSLLARAKSLKLGSVEVPSPVIDIALVERGAFANRYLAGNVGGGVLRRFDVTFDYGKQRLYLKPNESFAATDAFDLAGLWLNRAAGGLAVMDVVAGGPAAEAGLAVGDTVLAIDGRSATELSLPDVRARWKESAPGTRVQLRVRSGATTREVVLTLRELV